MELLIYVANGLYLVSYAVRDILHLRILTIVAACCLAVYFYNQVQPMMTVVYWNVFFVALNAIQLGRIYRERMGTVENESSDAGEMIGLRDPGVRFTQDPVESDGFKFAVFDNTCGNLIQIYQSAD